MQLASQYKFDTLLRYLCILYQKYYVNAIK